MIRMIITNAKLNSKRGRIKNNELRIMSWLLYLFAIDI